MAEAANSIHYEAGDEMKKTAIVRFIGKEENYMMECESACLKCLKTHGKEHPDCKEERQKNKSKPKFLYEKLYNAYFLDYWEASRVNLFVKGEDGEID